MEHFSLSDPEYELPIWDMIKILDIDIASALRTSELEMDELRKMVRKCSTCPEPGLCRIFLQVHEDGTGHTPSYCMNNKRMAELRARFLGNAKVGSMPTSRQSIN